MTETSGEQPSAYESQAEMTATVTFVQDAVPVALLAEVLGTLERTVYDVERATFLRLATALSAAEVQVALGVLDATYGLRCRVLAVHPGSVKFRLDIQTLPELLAILAATLGAPKVVEVFRENPKAPVVQEECQRRVNYLTDRGHTVKVEVTECAGVIKGWGEHYEQNKQLEQDKAKERALEEAIETIRRGLPRDITLPPPLQLRSGRRAP